MADSDPTSLIPSSTCGDTDRALPDSQIDQENGKEGAEPSMWDMQRQLLVRPGVFIPREQQRLLREQTLACVRDVGVLKHAIAARDSKYSARQLDSSCAETKVGELRDALERERCDRSSAEGDLQNMMLSLERKISGYGNELSNLRAQVSELESRFSPHLREPEAFLEHGLSETAAAHSQLHQRVQEVSELADGNLREADEREAARSRTEQRLRSFCERTGLLDTSADACASLQQWLETLDGGLSRQARAQEDAHRQLELSCEAVERRCWSEHSELGQTVGQHADLLLELQGALERERVSHGFHSSALSSRLDKLEAELRGQGALEVHLAACEGDAEELRGLLRSERDRLAACERSGAALGDLQKAHADLASRRADAEERQDALHRRVDLLESTLGSALQKQSSESEALRACHARFMEEVKAECSKAKLCGIREAPVTAESHDHARASLMAERIDALERALHDVTDKHARELRAAHADLDLLRGQLIDERSLREASAASVEHDTRSSEQVSEHERLKRVENLVEDLVRECSQKLGSQREAFLKHANDVQLADGFAAKVMERLGFLEKANGDLASRMAQDMAMLKQNVDRLEGILGSECERCTTLARDQRQENYRIWEAINTHTHDVSTHIVDMGGTKDAASPASLDPASAVGSPLSGSATAPPRLVVRGRSIPWTAHGGASVMVKAPSPAIDSRGRTSSPVATPRLLPAEITAGGMVRHPQPAPAPAVVHAAHQPAQAGAVRVMVSPVCRAPVPAGNGDLFSQLDTNGDGVITQAEFSQALARRGEVVRRQVPEVPTVSGWSVVQSGTPVTGIAGSPQVGGASILGLK